MIKTRIVSGTTLREVVHGEAVTESSSLFTPPSSPETPHPDWGPLTQPQSNPFPFWTKVVLFLSHWFIFIHRLWDCGSGYD